MKPTALVLPNSLEAEVCVLGSMMLEAEAIDKTAALIGPTDFFRPGHRLLFSALTEMHEAGQPVDLVTLPEALRAKKLLERVGGVEYLVSLVEGVPSAAHVETYARMVGEKAQLRNFIALCENGRDRAYAGAGGADELLAEFAGQAAGLGAGPAASGPVLTCLADVEPQEVRWLWPRRIPLGKLTLLVGDPDLGKSIITLDVAARVSRGSGFPGCPEAAGQPGGVVILSAEDDAADTIVPRLIAAGADLRRIVKLDAVRIADKERPFNLDDDLTALEAAIEKVPGCRLVIIDPVSAYLGGRIDSHRNAEVRAILAPLAEMAARHGLAIVAVAHLTKGQGPAMYRTSGSLGFVAAARSVYVFGKDKDDPTGQRRFMLRVKNNLTAEMGGLAYRLDATESPNGQPVVYWEADPVTITADEALRTEPERAGGDGVKEREAADWLRAELAQGPLRQKDILDRAAEDRIKERTLYRAKAGLKVESYRDGYGAVGVWSWKLPQAPGDQAAIGGHAQNGQAPTPETVATFGEAGNLWEKPKENGDFQAAPQAPDAKGCQAPETGNLCPGRPAGGLDPDRPGPTDLLGKAQYQRYRSAYDAHDGEPGAKHAVAWRAALRPPEGSLSHA